MAKVVDTTPEDVQPSNFEEGSEDRAEANEITRLLFSNAAKLEEKEINCPNIGTTMKAYIQGMRGKKEVIILTVHDLGCNHKMYLDFVSHPAMQAIRDRTVWVHVDIPGQQPDAPDLPPSLQFPTMQKLGEAMVNAIDQLGFKEVVVFGEGAGANILARFAMANPSRVLGACLIHCTGTTAGFMESLKDKFAKAEDPEQLRAAIENYQAQLRTKTNPRNLKKFVESFLKRTSIAENIGKVKCPVLFVTGQKSVFKSTTRALHEHMLRQTHDKTKIEYIELHGVANVLEGKTEKLAESFQYFLQGLGLVSSIPMYHVTRGPRGPRMRSMSMEEYDKPIRQRSMSSGSTASQLSCSPLRDKLPTIY